MDKTTHEVRLHQWSEMIQAQLSSGKSKREWCRENGVSEKQFFYWQRQVRRELYESQTGALVARVDTSGPSLVELPIAQGYRSQTNQAAQGFRPDAIISIGNVTVGVAENVSEALLMSIGKMIRHAL